MVLRNTGNLEEQYKDAFDHPCMKILPKEEQRSLIFVGTKSSGDEQIVTPYRDYRAVWKENFEYFHPDTPNADTCSNSYVELIENEKGDIHVSTLKIHAGFSKYFRDNYFVKKPFISKSDKNEKRVLSELKTLYISQPKFLMTDFPKLPKIRYLHFLGDKIENLPETPLLETLWLETNLKSFDGFPKKYPSLTEFYYREVPKFLSKEGLASLKEIPKMPNLKKLSFNDVNLKNLKGITNIASKKLEEISFHNNSLETLKHLREYNESFSFENLRKIDLQYNALENFEGLEEINMPKLQRFYADYQSKEYNEEEVKNALEYLSRFRGEEYDLKFDEYFNEIEGSPLLKSLKGMPKELPVLEYLDLSMHRLKSLKNLPKINNEDVSINLNYGSLKSVHGLKKTGLSEKNLELYANPL